MGIRDSASCLSHHALSSDGSKRYMAGENLEQALELMTKLSSEEACFTVDVLGGRLTPSRSHHGSLMSMREYWTQS